MIMGNCSYKKLANVKVYIYTFVYMYDMNVKNTENMANKFIFPSMYVEKEM